MKQGQKLHDKPVEAMDQSERPSSPGTASRSVTPKDITSENASAPDAVDRELAKTSGAQHQQSLLDEASEESFPASDPPAVPAVSNEASNPENEDSEEHLLDEAVELTFPASDPIAISSELHQEQNNRARPQPHR
jgi:hypothetical protein